MSDPMTAAIVGGVVANTAQSALSKAAHGIGEHLEILGESLEPNHEVLARIADRLDDIYRVLKRNTDPDQETLIMLLTNNEVKMWRQGRKHYCVFVTATIKVDINVIGLGASPYVVTLAAGWNSLDFPDGSTLTIDASDGHTQFPALVRATDTMLGSVI